MSVVEQDNQLLLELQEQAEQELAAGDVAFEVATEEEVAAFVLDTSTIDASLKFVSLRGRCGAWDANQGNQAKTLPPVMHYNGPATGVAKGADPVARLIGSARYHQQIDWGNGARANGLQYHSAVWEDIIYLCRNPLSRLWHAANQAYNNAAHACQSPIGGSERTTLQTRRTLEMWFDEINRTWGTRGAVGHEQVSLTGTDCPGPTQEDFVVPYRAGKSFGAPSKPAPNPSPKPGPTKTLHRVFAGNKQRGAFEFRKGSLTLAGELLDDFNEVRITKVKV